MTPTSRELDFQLYPSEQAEERYFRVLNSQLLEKVILQKLIRKNHRKMIIN
jgi:hypothetical protein